MTRATALGASMATNLLWRPTSSRRSRLRYVLVGAGSATSGGVRNAPPWTTRKGELVVPRDGTLPKTRVALDKDQASGVPMLVITGEVASAYFGRAYLQEGIDARLN